MNLVVLYVLVGIIVIVSATVVIFSLKSNRPVVRAIKWINIVILSIIMIFAITNSFEKSLQIESIFLYYVFNVFIVLFLAFTTINLLYLLMLVIHKIQPKYMF
jgi:chromate transport protein ChrA